MNGKAIRYLAPVLYGVFMAVAGAIVRQVFQVTYGEPAYLEKVLPFLVVAATGAVLCFRLQRKNLEPTWDNDGKIVLYLLYVLPIIGIILFFWFAKASLSLSFAIPIIASALIGIGEETVMRRTFFVSLLQDMSFGRALLVSSAVFGVLHGLNVFSGMPIPQALTQVGVTFLAGLFIGLMYDYTKSFPLAIIQHALWDYLLLCGVAKDFPIVGIMVVALMVLQAVLTVLLLIRRFRMKPQPTGEAA